MTDIILTGYPGAGKTVVGSCLAELLGLPLVDTDAEIERSAGCSIAEFWAAHGEPAFRDREHDVWRRLLCQGGDRVIATGGGLLVQERNRALLPASAVVFALTASPATLMSRLLPEVSLRPHLAGLDEEALRSYIEVRLTQRAPVYRLFESICTDEFTPREVASIIALHNPLPAAVIPFEGHRTSRLLVGRGLLGTLPRIPREGTRNLLLVTDETVAALPWVSTIQAALEVAGMSVHMAVIPPGEKHKTLRTVEELFRCAQRAALDRDAVVLGVGGGVVCDLAGFVAATYVRGLPLVLVPTTLLAGVDAAIGGKTGVDLDSAKNLVGAIYPAESVVIDPDLFRSLPPAALSDGLAEMIKIAVMRDEPLLESLEALPAREDMLRRVDLIRRAVLDKARVVAGDPFERHERMLLNYGHTIGHGLEAASGYTLSHGSAVAIGLVAEAWLAERLGGADGVRERLEALLPRLGLPLRTSRLDIAAVYDAMRQDKKRRAGILRFALPLQAGRGEIMDVTEEDARAAVSYAVGEIQ